MDSSANRARGLPACFSQKHEAIISLVMRQTAYDRAETIKRLHDAGGRYLDVIRNYINPEVRTNIASSKTTNQMIMAEIRHFMDDVHRGYRQRKRQKQLQEALRLHSHGRVHPQGGPLRTQKDHLENHIVGRSEVVSSDSD